MGVFCGKEENFRGLFSGGCSNFVLGRKWPRRIGGFLGELGVLNLGF